MADDTSAFVIPLHQVPRKRRAKTSAERAKAYRQRKRQKKEDVIAPKEAESTSSEVLIAPEFLSVQSTLAEPPATRPSLTLAPPQVTPPQLAEPVKASRRQTAPALLSTAAVALAAVGMIINGSFARSLGSSEIAGWLFLAIGVAADLVALVMPSCASRLWQARQRTTALIGWAIWIMTFMFAVTAGIGFASTNISDVALARASRITPAVLTAQVELTDAMAARDRECKSGVGRYCRDREAAVSERRQILDTAMATVGRTADPQTEAAIKLVTWVSLGALRPAADDFTMLRLALLALLPQIGGILLMVGRSRA
jgi:hypothetical protein